MKKFIAFFIVVTMLVAIAVSMNVQAKAGDLYNIEHLATYTPALMSGDAKGNYVDGEGEQRLFDGIIPTAEELDKFVADNNADEWYMWKGWIATAYTIAGVYEKDKKIAYEFTFSEAVNFKKMTCHAAAMATGSVGLPKLYEVFVSEDGETWSEVAAASATGGNVANTKKLETVDLVLDEAVYVLKVRLVMTRGDMGEAWGFLSEVELYAEEDGTGIISIEDPSEEPSVEPSEEPTTPTGDSGYVALSLVALFALAAVVVVKKSR